MAGHPLDALVVVRQHRVGHVGTHVRRTRFISGWEGAVGVPERKGRIVGKSLGAPDTLVVLAEAAVRILEKERREETAVRRGVKRLLNPLRALDREPRKLPGLPQLLAAAAHLVERKAVDLVQAAPAPAGSTDEMATRTVTCCSCRVAKRTQNFRSSPHASQSLRKRFVS